MYVSSGCVTVFSARLTGGAVRSPAQAEGMLRMVVVVDAWVSVVVEVVVVVLVWFLLLGIFRLIDSLCLAVDIYGC